MDQPEKCLQKWPLKKLKPLSVNCFFMNNVTNYFNEKNSTKVHTQEEKQTAWWRQPQTNVFKCISNSNSNEIKEWIQWQISLFSLTVR